MPTKVTVPLIGEGVEEVTLLNWLKAEGDPVQEHEGLLEIETDKVVTEIPSPVAGVVLKIMAPETGVEVRVGTVLAWIGEPGEAIPDAGECPPSRKEPQAAPQSGGPTPEQAPSPQPPPASPPDAGQTPAGFISPVVARIAAARGVDLAQVRGTGLRGRITKKDVLAYLEGRAAPEAPPKDALPSIQGELIPHTTVRRRIAEHMVRSKRTSPHVLTVMEADLSRVIAHRQANKGIFAREGLRLTFTPYFVAAVAQALRAFPMVNSSWREDGIVLHPQVNIGMATDLGDEGLIVPVIRDADQRSLRGLARAVNDLAERARSKRLKPDEVQGGTFSITNHGVSGSLFAFPVINQPQCAILGVGAIQKRALVVTDQDGNDAIAIRPMVYLSLVFDHRILDGAGADHFLAQVVEILENWQ